MRHNFLWLSGVLTVMKKILIAGGSGLIGSALAAAAINKGWNVEILSRSAAEKSIAWNPVQRYIAIKEARKYDVIVNLAGSSIAGKRWTTKRKKDILQSRIDACQTLEKYIHSGLLKTETYIGASAIGIYGERGGEQVDEFATIQPTDDWMIDTVMAWESAHHKIENLGPRVVIFRIGLVLSMKGGALKEILRTAPLHVFGYFGSGRQVWSWIHIEDLVSAMLKSMEDPNMSGVYLANSPQPLTNKEITTAARKEYAPISLLVSVPVWLLTIMLGKMHQMLMVSCKCHPRRLLATGFQFMHSNIEEALKDLNSTRR